MGAETLHAKNMPLTRVTHSFSNWMRVCMDHRSGIYLSLGYFVLPWFDLLTEINLFYNYYKFLVGSSLGIVERLFVPYQAGANELFILFIA